jgi:hypothetical protein
MNQKMIIGDQEMLFGDISNKRIGIGTTSPETQLHIENDGDVTVIMNADINNSTGELNNPRLELRQDGEGVIGAVGLSGANESNYPNTISNALYLVNENASPVQLGTDSVTRDPESWRCRNRCDRSRGSGCHGNARFRGVTSGAYNSALNLTSTVFSQPQHPI